ncbi:MAG: hypothetical protein HOP02_08915 [Methylococcaceae bacterium]|nr:hypothetical protein [Methylococcaceae bacterium]
MGSVTLLFLIMFIIAGCAFAPLGYFIYKFTQENGKPFGETEPHGDSQSWVLDLAEKLIHKAKAVISKK